MPLLYTSPGDEHLAVRNRLGVFDISHMGQLEVTGPGARDYLERALTNDVRALGPGQGQYTLLCVEDGGVIDDLIVYALLDRFLLVVNASNTAACREWLTGRAPADVEVNDRSLEIAMLALQGREWEAALGPLVRTPAPLGLEYFEITEDEVAGVPAFVARTGYTGEPGVEIMCPSERAVRVWDALMRGEVAPAPCGLVARDTLRTEMGYPLYGQELSRERTPVEAGLRWACDLEGGFTGDERCRAQVAEGTPEKLVAFVLTEPGIPRPGCAVLAGGRVVGRVTSGTLSPCLGTGIGMAYLETAVANPGTDVAIDVRGKEKAARLAKRPLVDTSPKGRT
jgi:glycine cleavage system T protein (aminomethyltransferase)